jgi:hypothetical protein
MNEKDIGKPHFPISFLISWNRVKDGRRGMAKDLPKSSIFRSKVVQKYMQNSEKNVLPRIVAPPVFAFCWVVLTLLIAAGIAVWSGRVPIYLIGSGIVLDATSHQSDGVTAVVLLSSGGVSRLRTGLPVRIQIGHNGPVLDRTINAISEQPLSPAQVHQLYGLEIAEPAFVLTVGLGPTIAGHLYAGSLVQAQIQVGTQSLLSLFPL